MDPTLLIDFGSTFTKVTALDVEGEEVVATAKAPTTVDTDVTRGLAAAVELLERAHGGPLRFRRKVACSSAAGGLRMVAVGLVPSLTVQAASMAALSAGAKLVGVHGYELTPSEVAEIAARRPDVILLAGGTDGGNREVIVHNAEVLARSSLAVPVVMAGNKAAREPIRAIFAAAGKDVRFAANVLPAVHQLDIEPCRQAIREVFIDRIVHAKGIDRAAGYVDGVLMPTPNAVMQAARLLAGGTPDEPGLGDLVMVDIGGATTDVYSVCSGHPARTDVVLKGLPEPHAKRTVEGDLGVRYNALSILEAVGAARLSARCGLPPPAVERTVARWSEETATVPSDPAEVALDQALAFFAADLAVTRHAGEIEPYYTPIGTTFVQRGKDLGPVRTVIGTGGAVVHSPSPRGLLAGVLADPADPNRLKPRAPAFHVDGRYLLYAIGLLAETDPTPALRIMKRNLATPSEH